MFIRTALALLAVALSVVAQSTTGTSSAASATPSIGACVLQCLQSSESSSSCSDYTNLSCTCTNATYQTAVATCIASACPDQLGAATELQATECSGSSSGSSGTSTAPGSSSTGSHTTSSSSASTSGSSSGAAGAFSADLHIAGAAAVGVLGLVFGGVVAL